jgi:hypothetical protein
MEDDDLLGGRTGTRARPMKADLEGRQSSNGVSTTKSGRIQGKKIRGGKS